jgi:hypothetical protein
VGSTHFPEQWCHIGKALADEAHAGSALCFMPTLFLDPAWETLERVEIDGVQ